jgi:hypothetical protein
MQPGDRKKPSKGDGFSEKGKGKTPLPLFIRVIIW